MCYGLLCRTKFHTSGCGSMFPEPLSVKNNNPTSVSPPGANDKIRNPICIMKPPRKHKGICLFGCLSRDVLAVVVVVALLLSLLVLLALLLLLLLLLMLLMLCCFLVLACCALCVVCFLLSLAYFCCLVFLVILFFSLVCVCTVFCPM